MVKALIFDVDGTLAETEEAHRRAFNETFAAFGLDWDWTADLYRDLLRTTGGKERMRAFARDHRGLDPDRLPIAAIHEQKSEIYGEMVLTGRIPLRPGIPDLLGDARATGLRLAVATTTNLPNVEALIRGAMGCAATDVFEVVAAGDMVAAKKPAPDVYTLALAGLDLKADDCIAFEDSRNGLLSARAAGLRCVVCPSGYTDRDDLSGATAGVSSYEDIATVAALDALLRPA
jgi:HAD superfamily hydrolase (TIGR01509 family)